MIKKRLQLIYSERPVIFSVEKSDDVNALFFSSWKELHKHLFEHGLYREFQVTDQEGNIPLYYRAYYPNRFELRWDKTVPGSVLFEIVNRHASAHL